MWKPRPETVPQDAALELPDMGMEPPALAQWMHSQFVGAVRYARGRRNWFRGVATVIRMTVLALSGSATVILGLQHLTPLAGLAFSFIAVSTVVGALEAYFNWRPRWLVMERAQARFYALTDEMHHYCASTRPDQLDPAQLAAFFETYLDVWADLSSRWMDSRQPVPSEGV